VEEALSQVPRLQELDDAGYDVSGLSRTLNQTIWLAREGRVEEARGLLSSIEENITLLEEEAGAHRLAERLGLAAEITALALLPPAVHLLLPRAYLYLWAWARRRWVVEGEPPRP